MPDLLFNGRIATMDSAVPSPEALLTDGAHVAFVGTRAEAEALARKLPGTRRVDLGGHCVIPGLIDMHAHLDREGLKALHPPMTGLRSRADVLSRIADLARQAAPGEWIVTSPIGEPPFYFFETPEAEADLYPTRWELDEAAPHHPVYIRPILGFWRWSPWPERLVSAANTAAMQTAGLTGDIAPPTPSVELERGPDGSLSGRFFERTTASLLEILCFGRAFQYSNADRIRGLELAQQIALRYGVTSIYEGHGVEQAVLEAYNELHRRGRMAIRAELVFSPDWLNASDSPDRTVERELAGLSGDGQGDDVLRTRGIFINPLVTPDDRARGRARYTGMAGYRFGSGLSESDAIRVLQAVARSGMRAVGLTPVLFGLMERVARDIDIRPLRWLVQHCGHLPRAHSDIAARCNLGLSFLPVEACYKQAAKLRDDPARVADFMPLRRLLDAGQPISIASDNIPPSLFFAIWCCLARRDYRGQVLPDPDGPISRHEALSIATLGAARCLGRANSLGSLTPGKYADLVVLDRDYFDCPLDDIPKIRAEATMVGGDWRHGDPENLGATRDRMAVDSC
jgi:predicted amidohydrolase YtcJ